MNAGKIVFSQHSLDQLKDRGTTKKEIIETICEGEVIPAQKGRTAYRKNFPFNAVWKEKHYEIKQVMPIVREEEQGYYVVITVYVFYFGGTK